MTPARRIALSRMMYARKRVAAGGRLYRELSGIRNSFAKLAAQAVVDRDFGHAGIYAEVYRLFDQMITRMMERRHRDDEARVMLTGGGS